MSLEGSLSALYSPGGRVTSRLDLRDNQKVITDYRNIEIIHIIIDLVISSGYISGVLREAPSRVVPRKASSCGLGHPWGHSPCGLPWVSRVRPPTVILNVHYTFNSKDPLFSGDGNVLLSIHRVCYVEYLCDTLSEYPWVIFVTYIV